MTVFFRRTMHFRGFAGNNCSLEKRQSRAKTYSEMALQNSTPINKEDGRVASSKFIIIFKLWSLQNRGDWWALVLLKSSKTVAKIAMRFTYHLTAGQRCARQETLVISYRSFYDLHHNSFYECFFKFLIKLQVAKILVHSTYILHTFWQQDKGAACLRKLWW